MSNRIDLMQEFLARAGWDEARRDRMTGDASTRSYVRLTKADGRSAVLMDAPHIDGQTVHAFLSVGAFLRDHSFSAPRILAADESTGFLLLEDFGDGVFARLMDSGTCSQEELYESAVDMLVQLAKVSPPPGLTRFTPHHMTSMTEPVFDWYAEGMGWPVQSTERGAILAFMEGALMQTYPGATSVSLRDCHAENLMWLPDRSGLARVGILDFQDAMVTHPAYDLVSLLQDARRDIPDALVESLIDRYVTRAGLDPQSFLSAFAVLGLQRNLRILGIFARLSLNDGKTRYLSMVPRVWAHIERNLEHPALERLVRPIRAVIPAPTDAALDRILHHVGA